MTTVTVFRRPDGALSGFDCRGHALYADAGEDIVCAAVSALTQGTLNGLLNVLKAPVDYHIDEKDGILTARQPIMAVHQQNFHRGRPPFVHIFRPNG